MGTGSGLGSEVVQARQGAEPGGRRSQAGAEPVGGGAGQGRSRAGGGACCQERWSHIATSRSWRSGSGSF